MQTNLAEFIKDTPEGKEADAILRSCVHCGFCTATCPTYQLLGDELDGPRGRIYLIKQVLEGSAATAKTQTHLDRCLSCRNCESTCPSGVEYGRLIDIGRKVVARQVQRPLPSRALRRLLAALLTRRWLFTPVMGVGQLLRPLLPTVIRNKIPLRQRGATWPASTHHRTMLLLAGCVQPAISPNINAAAARVLDKLGIRLITAAGAGCCGAIRHHLDQHEAALDDIRRNLDAWAPLLSREDDEQVEAIVMTASGCGVTVKEYGRLLAHDPAYAALAARVSALTRDLSEVLAEFDEQLLTQLTVASGQRVAYHPPCTLQHGQQIRGKVERVLGLAGAHPLLCTDSHLCCGSAGTYSVLQPTLAYQLRNEKLQKLAETGADVIVSANIGCIMHLQSGTDKPVMHWIEWLEQALIPAAPSASVVKQ